MSSPVRPTPCRFFLSVAAAALAALPATAQQPAAQAAAAAPAPDYAETADLVLQSPMVVDATIRSAAKIKGAEAAGVAPGHTRFYVEGDVIALVRGTGAIPPRVGWLVDVAPDWRGRTPNLKKQRVLAFARPVAGRPDQIQLVTPEAQRSWSPALESLARRIAQEAAAADAPPVVTGVRNAFHVPGALPGEGETQIFLTTQGDRPAALSILRRPGEQPRWSVALSEIIDDAAAAPTRDTLLWYRLACALPPTLPDRSTAALSDSDAQAAREDYAFVIAALGPCRNGTIPSAAGTISGSAVSGGGGPA
ncbi:MAG: hypothetical protein PGN23_13205 [Sphingomonas adhaesiva]|uniref:hypothetical protein n=1 Tax=Sphingomonas adhaesiva TaxID=28212 RepID=UPI002FFCA5FA